jgi:hypothetical protein
MKNIKTFENYINESVTFYVYTGKEQQIKNITDLAHYLQHKVYRLIEQELNDFQIKRFKEEKMPKIITTDGDYLFESSGIINFYILGFNEDLVKKSILLIKETLHKLPNVEYDSNFIREQSKSAISEVIRIKIISIEPPDIVTPEINISNSNFEKVMKNLLGYSDVDYSGSINVSELILKLNKAKEELNKYQSSTSYTAMRKPIGRGIYGPKELGQDYYRNIIDNLLKLTSWAVAHGYSEIDYA